jgi:hypothetical protein
MMPGPALVPEWLAKYLTHDSNIAAASLINWMLIAILGCVALYYTAQGLKQSRKDSARSNAEAMYANDIAYTSALSEYCEKGKDNEALAASPMYKEECGKDALPLPPPHRPASSAGNGSCRRLAAVGTLQLAAIGTLATRQTLLEVAAMAAALALLSYFVSNSTTVDAKWAFSLRSMLIIAAVIFVVLRGLHQDRLDVASTDTHGLALSKASMFGREDVVSVAAGSTVVTGARLRRAEICCWAAMLCKILAAIAQSEAQCVTCSTTALVLDLLGRRAATGRMNDNIQLVQEIIHGLERESVAAMDAMRCTADLWDGQVVGGIQGTRS